MRHKNSKAIFTYWNNLRGNRSAPDRREIEPSDIREILGDTFILEMDKTYRTASFRLAGTRLCNSYGRELKGLGFLAIWDEVDNLGIYNALRTVHEESRPCAISCIAQSEGDRFSEFEFLLLPLQNGDSSAKRILGTASPLSETQWMGADPLIGNRMKSIRYLDVETAGKAPALFASIPESTSQGEDEGRQIAHLRVFDGGLS